MRHKPGTRLLKVKRLHRQLLYDYAVKRFEARLKPKQIVVAVLLLIAPQWVWKSALQLPRQAPKK